MKIHIVTIGRPKLAYARQGWDEYIGRLGRYHQLRVTHVADKYANDDRMLSATVGNAFCVTLEIDGRQLSSRELSDFFDKRSLEGRETCFIIGGPDGLSPAISQSADFAWSLSRLTFPHDLAMVVLAETLYRAATIGAGHPYHRA